MVGQSKKPGFGEAARHAASRSRAARRRWRRRWCRATDPATRRVSRRRPRGGADRRSTTCGTGARRSSSTVGAADSPPSPEWTVPASDGFSPPPNRTRSVASSANAGEQRDRRGEHHDLAQAATPAFAAPVAAIGGRGPARCAGSAMGGARRRDTCGSRPGVGTRAGETTMLTGRVHGDGSGRRVPRPARRTMPTSRRGPPRCTCAGDGGGRHARDDAARCAPAARPGATSNRTGRSSVTASPSIPASTGLPDRISR